MYTDPSTMSIAVRLNNSRTTFWQIKPTNGVRSVKNEGYAKNTRPTSAGSRPYSCAHRCPERSAR